MLKCFFRSGIALFLLCIVGCSSIELIESPKTAFVPDSPLTKEPDVVWTSRAMIQDFDFLGQVKTRSLSYDKSFELLLDGGSELRADALIDIHYEQAGIFSTMQAFAVKYK